MTMTSREALKQSIKATDLLISLNSAIKSGFHNTSVYIKFCGTNKPLYPIESHFDIEHSNDDPPVELVIYVNNSYDKLKDINNKLSVREIRDVLYNNIRKRGEDMYVTVETGYPDNPDGWCVDTSGMEHVGTNSVFIIKTKEWN